MDPHIVLFCGGRGSATLTRELLGHPRIRLSLLVNAYDDGLSTGAMRDFISGMLGPSDFRKNLSCLLALYSARQYSLQQLLEYRLPKSVDRSVIDNLEQFARTREARGLPDTMGPMISELDGLMRNRFAEFLRFFFDYAKGRDDVFGYADCSFGNLVFAGAYLKTGSFNAAARELATLCSSQAELINVSRGECRALVALKEDGQILSCEAEIVGPQSAAPIRDFFFFERRPNPAEVAAIADLPVAEKEAWLRSRQAAVELSDEAKAALEEADIIIYGPGTQYSSLLPSYRIASEAIRCSPAVVKALVLNLREDHDIQGLSATDIVDRALIHLTDPEGRHRVVTHILYNRESGETPSGIALDPAALDTSGTYRGARLIVDDFQNPVKPLVHNGYAVIQKILTVYEEASEPGIPQTLDVYVNLLGRSTGLDSLLQEFQELSWADHFQRVRLWINNLPVPKHRLPPQLKIEAVDFPGDFSEGYVLRHWVVNGEGDYLATLTGDGEYRLRDILVATTVIRTSGFGAVLGSRSQSRRQFRSSLRAAYGEGSVLYWVSWLWEFILSGLASLRFGVIFSDPLTGFRVYKRGRLSPRFMAAVERQEPMTTGSITNMLIATKVEIAEIPVGYRTFAGFTKPGWRVTRALWNLPGILFGASLRCRFTKQLASCLTSMARWSTPRLYTTARSGGYSPNMPHICCRVSTTSPSRASRPAMPLPTQVSTTPRG